MRGSPTSFMAVTAVKATGMSTAYGRVAMMDSSPTPTRRSYFLYILMASCYPGGSVYWIGRFDRKSLRFIADASECLRIDYANPFHCFNPPTLDAKGPNGFARRIIMAMESRLEGSVDGLPWNGVHAM